MKRKEAIQMLQIYKDELEQRINEADDSDVKDVYQWQVDGFYMAIEALQTDIVHCKDCKRYESDGGALMICDLTELIVVDDCYCW